MTCPSCAAENRDGARFCDSCGASLSLAPPREQRKIVTVLFCDVSGSTAFAESRDPEAVRAVMARYFEVARAAVERHGGTVEKFIGDAVMAVFGVPTIREDDALRAVRAAEELRDAVDIPVRIGVNTGEVMTGSGDSLVTGDAVNVAARLEQAAAPGEVLIGDATLALVRDAVDAELLPPLEAKGKSEPLTVHRLVAVTGETAFARRLDAPFVGRGREGKLLADAWERVVSERACALFTVLGSAGVGKSRLSTEFLTGHDAAVVSGRCLSYGEGITYWPVVEVVRQLLGGRPAPDAAIAALLEDGVAPADEIALAVRRLFEAAAAERPLVVLFDDLQWGEPTFLDLVEHVADWSRDAPIFLLCLARPELLDARPAWGGGKLNATTVLLEPLSLEETDRLIDVLLADADLEPSLRERIRSASEGNPLFVEQMLAMIESSPGEVTVPASIRALLAARLDQLPAAERAALERGSVEGQVFHRGAVVALAPDDPDVASRLPRLIRKELVRPNATAFPGDEAFRFRHLLIRDAAYDALPKAARAELHERFAIWVETHEDLVELDEIVGYHLEQAARYRSELGLPADELGRAAAARLGAAGTRAFSRDDARAAVSLLGRAAALLPVDDPARIALVLELGRACHESGDLERCYALYGEVIELGDGDLAAEAFFQTTYAHAHGESTSAIEMKDVVAAKLAELGSTAGDRVLAVGQLVLGWAEFWAGGTGAAIEAGERALVLAERSRSPDVEREALRLLAGSKVHGPTPWPDIERHASRLEAAGLRAGLLRMGAAAMRGDFDEMRRRHEAWYETQLERGRLIDAYGQGSTAGRYEYLGGDIDRGIEILRRAWAGLGAMGERGLRSTVGGELGELLARNGALDEAEEVLDEAGEMGTPDDWVTVSQVAVGRALVASRRGRHDLAVELAREAAEIADSHDYFSQQQVTWLAYGEVLAAAGNDAEAREALGHAREIAERKVAPTVVRHVDGLLAALAPATR
ncbi:MAG TPA: adenylate/guanylate cyclase domain-containing protein [Gaiellaceae bacterium]|nr:adenylate/guanylate cyclase domain-containing protein [Gaiellaceae bacterium]